MDQCKLAYYAGLFDGEGCIRINRIDLNNGRTPKFNLQVFISNQNREILIEIQDAFHGSIWVGPGCYRYSLSGLEAYNFLYLIKPYSRIKLPEIEVAIKFQQLQNNGLRGSRKTPEQVQEREALRQEITALKQVDKIVFKQAVVEPILEQVN